MYGLVFDLDTKVVERDYPRGTSQAYSDIRLTLEPFGFRKIQGSTYAADHEDFGKLFLAITALRKLSWFGSSLRNLRVFRMDQGTDVTSIMKTVN